MATVQTPRYSLDVTMSDDGFVLFTGWDDDDFGGEATLGAFVEADHVDVYVSTHYDRWPITVASRDVIRALFRNAFSTRGYQPCAPRPSRVARSWVWSHDECTVHAEWIAGICDDHQNRCWGVYERVGGGA